jgi:hypothetical protein
MNGFGDDFMDDAMKAVEKKIEESWAEESVPGLRAAIALESGRNMLFKCPYVSPKRTAYLPWF